MNSDSEKAQAFVGRLLQNPALNGFSPLQQEEQIVQFLHANSAQLAPTLSSGQFFPGKNWTQIFTLLVSALYETIDDRVEQEIRDIVSGMDFTFIQLLRQQSVDNSVTARQITDYLIRLKSKTETRRELTGPLTVARFGLLTRYMDEIFTRKSYIHFELTKVQRLRMGMEEVGNFVVLNVLLKPVLYNYVSNTAGHQEHASGMVQNQVAEKALPQLGRDLKILPEPVLKSVLHSSVSFNDNRFIEATARLAAIFAARGRNFQNGVRVDRGADSPDKSWFSTARRNFRFYGFDIKMLDELYKIAAENMW